MILRRTATVLPSIGVSLMPKLMCPLCWPAYAGLLSAVGLGFLVNAQNLLVVTAFFLTVAVAALAYQARRRRSYGPAFIGLAAGAAILIGKFYLESSAAMYGGISLLVAASIWNSWPIRRGASCSQCVAAHEIVLKEKL